MYKVVINADYGGFKISKEAVEWLRNEGADPAQVVFIDEFVGGWTGLERHDPLLVRCVETLGERANGSYAALEVRLLKQPLYRIREYDGAERIEEPADLRWSNAADCGGGE
jgi:hypothetical protein